jgi:hypothetical protein
MQKLKNSKKKSNSSITASSEIIYHVISNGIKIYPIYKNYFWFIQVDNNGKITTYDKRINQNEINDCVAKTIIHFYKLLKEKENEKL